MQVIKFETLENQLFTLRHTLVLLDKDVAKLYEIEAKKLRQQLKRNLDMFPKDYAFQVSDRELDFVLIRLAPKITRGSIMIMGFFNEMPSFPHSLPVKGMD